MVKVEEKKKLGRPRKIDSVKKIEKPKNTDFYVFKEKICLPKVQIQKNMDYFKEIEKKKWRYDDFYEFHKKPEIPELLRKKMDFFKEVEFQDGMDLKFEKNPEILNQPNIFAGKKMSERIKLLTITGNRRTIEKKNREFLERKSKEDKEFLSMIRGHPLDIIDCPEFNCYFCAMMSCPSRNAGHFSLDGCPKCLRNIRI